MTTAPSETLDAARSRVRAAWSPELLASAGQRLMELLSTHLSSVESSGQKVLNWAEPADSIARAMSCLDENSTASGASRSAKNSPEQPLLLERFEQLVQLMLASGHNLHDPRYLGHQVPASVPVAGLFDAVGSITNQVMAIYEMGPWATSVEAAVVEQLGRLIGWDAGEFAGVVTHGGSLANLTALLTARNVCLGDAWERGISSGEDGPVLVSHGEAHYCIARSAGILGLGTDQVIKAALDERRRIDPCQLDQTLRRLRQQNRPIVAVVACACATPIGAFDPLVDIADVCARHDVWLHVDAAHGGAACFSRKHRHLVEGLDQADSLIWDAHKMLFVPALCAFVFYRNREHRFEAFRQDAPYLFDPSDPGLAEYDSGLKTIECTKRAAAFGLWGTWSLFGRELFGDLVDITFDLGQQLYRRLQEAEDFVPLHEPECNIVVFRHIPRQLREAPPAELGQFQLALRKELVRSGEYYIVPTAKDGVAALRVTLINPLTGSDQLDGLLDALRTHGQRLLSGAAAG